MPYIPSADRPSLDDAIAALAAAINGDADDAGGPSAGDSSRNGLDDDSRAGRLNYAITRVVSSVYPSDRYHRAALATGVLENVKQELYRRAIAPYEDEKIAQNGDVIEYE